MIPETQASAIAKQYATLAELDGISLISERLPNETRFYPLYRIARRLAATVAEKKLVPTDRDTITDTATEQYALVARIGRAANTPDNQRTDIAQIQGGNNPNVYLQDTPHAEWLAKMLICTATLKSTRVHGNVKAGAVANTVRCMVEKTILETPLHLEERELLLLIMAGETALDHHIHHQLPQPSGLPVQ